MVQSGFCSTYLIFGSKTNCHLKQLLNKYPLVTIVTDNPKEIGRNSKGGWEY
jgi:hypothetical protein